MRQLPFFWILPERLTRLSKSRSDKTKQILAICPSRSYQSSQGFTTATCDTWWLPWSFWCLVCRCSWASTICSLLRNRDRILKANQSRQYSRICKQFKQFKHHFCKQIIDILSRHFGFGLCLPLLAAVIPPRYKRIPLVRSLLKQTLGPLSSKLEELVVVPLILKRKVICWIFEELGKKFWRC